MIRQSKTKSKSKRLSIVLCLLLIPFIEISGQLLNNFWQQKPLFNQMDNSGVVFAQSLSPELVSNQIYQLLPDIPLENEYIGIESKNRAVENTFITRLVRYHQYQKARPTVFRLDWKLTLADYLGKNEIINGDRYPGFSTLTQNPLQKDRQVIKNLTRKQRNDLVNALVSIYNPNYDRQDRSTQKESSPTQENTPPGFELPTPGKADLLLP